MPGHFLSIKTILYISFSSRWRINTQHVIHTINLPLGSSYFFSRGTLPESLLTCSGALQGIPLVGMLTDKDQEACQLSPQRDGNVTHQALKFLLFPLHPNYRIKISGSISRLKKPTWVVNFTRVVKQEYQSTAWLVMKEISVGCIQLSLGLQSLPPALLPLAKNDTVLGPPGSVGGRWNRKECQGGELILQVWETEEGEAHLPTQLQRFMHINVDSNKGCCRENLIISIFKIWNL